MIWWMWIAHVFSKTCYRRKVQRFNFRHILESNMSPVPNFWMLSWNLRCWFSGMLFIFSCSPQKHVEIWTDEPIWVLWFFSLGNKKNTPLRSLCVKVWSCRFPRRLLGMTPTVSLTRPWCMCPKVVWQIFNGASSDVSQAALLELVDPTGLAETQPSWWQLFDLENLEIP